MIEHEIVKIKISRPRFRLEHGSAAKRAIVKIIHEWIHHDKL
jgi:hypothetical protein